MTTSDMPTQKIHEGRNVKRIREILQIKQEALADNLGVSQQTVSLLEQKEALDPDMVKRIADALKVSEDAIKNFSEESAYTYFNTFTDHSTAGGFFGNYNTINNPIEKIIELYERLLQVEREKNELLQRMLEKK
jgi:transcriptional regulator with XRE-family HTH domain